MNGRHSIETRQVKLKMRWCGDATKFVEFAQGDKNVSFLWNSFVQFYFDGNKCEFEFGVFSVRGKMAKRHHIKRMLTLMDEQTHTRVDGMWWWLLVVLASLPVDLFRSFLPLLLLHSSSTSAMEIEPHIFECETVSPHMQMTIVVAQLLRNL